MGPPCQGRHPGGKSDLAAFRGRVACERSARSSSVYRRLRRPPRGRTFPGGDVTDDRRRLTALAAKNVRVSERRAPSARARVDGEWAPFESVGTHRHPFTVDARARRADAQTGQVQCPATGAAWFTPRTRDMPWTLPPGRPPPPPIPPATATAEAATAEADRRSVVSARLSYRRRSSADSGSMSASPGRKGEETQVGEGRETTRRAGVRAVGRRRVGDAQRRYEVHDVPEDVGDDAQAPRRAPVHHRACVEGRESSESVRRGTGGRVWLPTGTLGAMHGAIASNGGRGDS